MKTRTIKNPNLAGFTLIEVMITVAVIAIGGGRIAKVLDPSRSRLAAKSNRGHAHGSGSTFDNRSIPKSASLQPGPPTGRSCRPPQNSSPSPARSRRRLHDHRHRDREHDGVRLHDRSGQPAQDDGSEDRLDSAQPQHVLDQSQERGMLT
jgi:prepilin-type N-terminal cleavage/methylation domain-containing protein